MTSEYSLVVRYIPVFNKYILGRFALMQSFLSGTVFDYFLITSIFYFFCISYSSPKQCGLRVVNIKYDTKVVTCANIMCSSHRCIYYYH